jgi:membrane-bound serine protease (ClpP class)
MLLRLIIICSGLLALVDTSPAPPAGPTPAPAYRQANTVAVLTLQGPIDEVTVPSLERRIAKAKADGAQAIVIDLNTPGGEMKATLDICFLIKTKFPANTVAWVNPQAYSAGTIIALACREIVVSPAASFGDAAPINAPGGMLLQLPAAERAKLESVLRSEVVDSARRNHYDEKLVQSFVAVNLELWMIQNTDTGDFIFVDADEYRLVMGEDPPKQRAGSSLPPPGATITPDFSQQFDTPQRATDRAVSPEEQAAHDEFVSLRPSARPQLSESDRGHWKLVMQVDSGEELLTVRTAEALFYGLARTTVANDQELAAYFGAQTVIRYDESWSEGLVRFLMSLPVRGILIVIFLVSLFIEIATPGVGFFGIAAAVALLLLVGAPALLGLAQWWTLVAILGGIILVAIELFVIPGFGITGMAGAACLLVGLVGTFVSGDLSTSEGQHELWTGIGTTVVSVFAAAIGMWLISRQLESLPFMKRLVLTAEIGTPGGDSGVGLLEAMAATGRVLQVGDQGMAATDLRPVGRAVFDGRLVEVQSAAGYVDKGSAVVIVGIDQSSIAVEELRA